MLYRIEISRRAKKSLDNLPLFYQRRIQAALVAISKDPFVGKKLEGEYKGIWSYRVWPYRILYCIDKKEILVLIINIKHRQSAYK